MEKKVQDKTVKTPFLFKSLVPPVPTDVWIAAMLEAQHRALVAIDGMSRSIERLELFWVVYNWTFRQYIEREERKNADFEA